jgi:putative peptidoglycan lipid II flippase
VGLLAALGYLISAVRDAVLAAFYGGSPALDVYFIGLAPAQFIGMEGASLVYLAFLPEFARAKGKEDGWHDHLLRARLRFAVKAGCGIALILVAVGVLVPQWLAPGYEGHRALSGLRASATVLAMLVPGLLALGVLRGALEARARFSPWALLPGFRSAVLIVCVLVSAARPQLWWLLVGSLLGVALAILYALRAERDPTRAVVAGPAGPSGPPPSLPPTLVPLLGAVLCGALTGVVDNAFASRAGVGGAQAFTIASNLMAAPQGIVGGVVATVFFPLYGRFWGDGHRPQAFASLSRSIRLVMLGLLPVVVLLVTEGGTIVRLVYRHGAFTDNLASTVGDTVGGLALGQAFYASTILLRQFLLVAGAPWAVCEAAALFLIAKWVGNALLLSRFGVPGVALASALAALITCAYLSIRVMRLAARSRETRA